MSAEMLAAVDFLQPVQPMPAAGGMGVDAREAAGFEALVARGLEQVNLHLQGTEVELQRLATGNIQNLHQVMIGLEEAKASFQLMMQVRNRLLDAYQEVMRMQI